MSSPILNTVFVRIVSVNAWGGALFDDLAAWLLNSAAEVVCLQEATRAPGAGGWTRFQDGERTLPQRANLFDDVQMLLPEHRAMFIASDSGPVYDAQGRRHQQDFGLATLVDERRRVVSAHAGFVHGSFQAHDDWPIDGRPRAVQAVRTADESGRIVTVIHLHGLRDSAGKGDTPERLQQAHRLASFVEESREVDDVVVVCGDFNLMPDSETFRVLADVGLTDLVRRADTRTSHYAKSVRHASYMLVSDPEAVVRFEILDTEVSDHRVLQLQL